MKQNSEFPRSILAETTLRCPADCIFCPNKKITERPQDMPWELFRKIVDECRDKGVEEFHPFINGEPLASPYLEDALVYINHVLPDAAVHIYTNGYLLDENTSNILLRNKVGEIHFSIDGVSKSTYEKHRRGLVYERVMSNVMGFLAQLGRHPKKVGTRAVLTMTADNEAEVPAFQQLWKDLVDVVDVIPCDGRGGDGRLPAYKDARTLGCFHVAYRTYILTDGSVVGCCKDWAGYSVLGNVAEQSLESIWNSAQYRQMRSDISYGVYHNFEVCRRCISDNL